MSLRFWLGVLTSGFSDLHDVSDSMNASETDGLNLENYDFQSPAKLHVGMLSISFIVGLAFGGFVSYICWETKDVFLGYVRNLVIALVCRTFFSILFDGVILLGSITNVGGGNTLLAFEQISLGIVLAFWLTLTIYSHAWVQRDFNSEPTLRLYQYGVPGVAVFFAFVWIFTLQDLFPGWLWWVVEGLQPLSKWIVNSVYLLYLFIQLGLVTDMARLMWMKHASLDNDSVSLLWRVAAILGTLVFYFWLHYGLIMGRMPLKNDMSYVNFYCIVDGLECAIVCLCLYFYKKWVPTLFDKNLPFLGIEGSSTSTTGEALLPGGRRIVTLDSVFMTSESGKLKTSRGEEFNDIVYSNVVAPERLEKTLELYKRLNVIPKQEVTVIDGEEFYECQIPNQIHSETENRKLSQLSLSKEKILNDETPKIKKETTCEQTQKKNAFYSSKYLILDSKDGDIPKYLETRPSVSSVSDKESPKEERQIFPARKNSMETEERVRKWLNDYSENMQKPSKGQNTKLRRAISEEVVRSRTPPEFKGRADIIVRQSSVTENTTPGAKTSEFFNFLDLIEQSQLKKDSIKPSLPEQTKELPSEQKKIAKDEISSGELNKDSFKPSVQEQTEKLSFEQTKIAKDEISPEEPNKDSFKPSVQEQTEKLPSEQKKIAKDEISSGEPNKDSFKPSVQEQTEKLPYEQTEIAKDEIISGEPNKDSFKPSVQEQTEKLPFEQTKIVEDETSPGKPNKDFSKPSVQEQTEKLPSEQTEPADAKQKTSLSSYITFSELQQFRLKRDKTTPQESSKDAKKSFSISDHIFFPIGSLLSAGGSFYDSLKKSEVKETIPSYQSQLNAELEEQKVKLPIEKQIPSINTEVSQTYLEANVEQVKTPLTLPTYQTTDQISKLHRNSLEQEKRRESEEIIYDYPKVQRKPIEAIETSSESEFSLENRKTSCDSFKLEEYCIFVGESRDKFYNQRSPLK